MTNFCSKAYKAAQYEEHWEKVALYYDILIFLQKAIFSEHEDSPSLTNC